MTPVSSESEDAPAPVPQMASGSQTIVDERDVAKDVHTKVDDSTTSRNIQTLPTEPSRGPNEGVETIQLAGAAGVKIVDFAYPQPGSRSPEPFPTKLDAWRLLALFDSQRFAHRALVETGRTNGFASLSSLYPAKEYLKLVECGWVSEEEFAWDDAREVLEKAKQAADERRKAGTERKWYMRPGATFGVAPTWEERHANVLRYAEVIATTFALRAGEKQREEFGRPEWEFEGDAFAPDEEDVELHKRIVTVNEARAKERRRCEEIMRMLEEEEELEKEGWDGEWDGGEEDDEQGHYGNFREEETEGKGIVDDAMEGVEIDGTVHQEEAEVEMGDDPVVRCDEVETVPLPIKPAPSSLQTLDGRMTRSQKRKLDAMNAPTTAANDPRKPLPRAACPPPLVTNLNASRPAKRQRNSRDVDLVQNDSISRPSHSQTETVRATRSQTRTRTPREDVAGGRKRQRHTNGMTHRRSRK